MPEDPVEAAPVFCRPQHKRPTTHLRLSGCGPGLGVPPDQLLEQLLRPLQCLRLAPWQGHQAHLFATFPDEPAATRALHALDGRAFLGRSISAKYAETREPRKVLQGVMACVQDAAVTGERRTLLPGPVPDERPLPPLGAGTGPGADVGSRVGFGRWNPWPGPDPRLCVGGGGSGAPGVHRQPGVGEFGQETRAALRHAV